MNRRKFIITSGSIAAVAGCTGSDPDGSDGPTEPDENEPSENTSGADDAEEEPTGGNGNDNESEGDGETTGEPEDERQEEDEEEEERGPYEFSGEGSEETASFGLQAGLTAIEFEHSGNGRFALDLESEDGNGELLVNASGAAEGSTARGIEAGTYTLSVEADGGWSLLVTQPSADAPEALPVSIEGNGVSHVGPVSFDGTVSVAGSHEGEGNFLVEALAEDGELIEQVINEVGEVETTTSFEHDGAGWIVVQADGGWSLSLE